MIRLEGVSFGYTRRRILDGVDLEIGAGLTLLLGPNGSGKSTLLKILAGVEQPGQGRVRIGAHDLWKQEIEARRDLAYVPEQPDVCPLARLDEVLGLVCGLRRVPRDRALEALELVGMAGLRSSSVRDLSLGQRRRVLLAAAMIGEPRVLLLDEPLETMDRAMQDLIADWIGRHKSRGGTIVVATHQIAAFIPLVDRGIGLDGGSLSDPGGMPSSPPERLHQLEGLARGTPRDAV